MKSYFLVSVGLLLLIGAAGCTADAPRTNSAIAQQSPSPRSDFNFETNGCDPLPQEAYFRTETRHINICRQGTTLQMVITLIDSLNQSRFPVVRQGDRFEGTSQGGSASVQVDPRQLLIRTNNPPEPPTEIREPVIRSVFPSPTPSPTSRITGTVNYRQRQALPQNAVVEVQLLDTSRADRPAAVLATQTIPTAGRQVPIPFSLGYNPADIQSGGSYAVQARILVNGSVRARSTDRYSVITSGNPTNNIAILVEPVGNGSQTSQVSGSVTYQGRQALPSNSTIDVVLEDITRSPATAIATQRIDLNGQQVPVPFTLNYDPAQIRDFGTYAVRATIYTGGAIFARSRTQTRVITAGNPTDNVQIVVEPVGTTPPPSSGRVQGSVTYRQQVSLSPDAAVSLILRETSSAGTFVISEENIATNGRQVPIPFVLNYDPAAIRANRIYDVQARIFEDGRLSWVSNTRYRVITQGNPSTVQIVVQRVRRPRPPSPAPIDPGPPIGGSW